MKINPTGTSNYITGARRVGNIGDAYKELSPLSSGDELAVSADALSFSKVFAAVKETNLAASVSLPARVSDIAARISDGSYHVDSEELAASILGDLYV